MTSRCGYAPFRTRSMKHCDRDCVSALRHSVRQDDVHDVTGVPESVVERTELRAVDGVRNLRNQHRSGVGYI